MTPNDVDDGLTGSAETEAGRRSTLEGLRVAFDKAAGNCRFHARLDVELHFGKPPVGMLSRKLQDRLVAILTPDGPSGFDTHDLRAAAGGFALERVFGSEAVYDEIIEQILPCFGGGLELKPPADGCWVEAGEIGLGLSMLDCFTVPDLRHKAVASAARRLTRQGYRLTLTDGRVEQTGPVIGEITNAICERLERLGLMTSLAGVLTVARQRAVHGFGQYLFGRQYDLVSSEAVIPFGFLLNLAVRTSDVPCSSGAPETDGREAVELARDLVAVVDVQPHNQFWAVNIAPRRIVELLSEIGLFDHLAAFRQWALPITPQLLDSFFGMENDDTLSEKLGWCVADAVSLAKALVARVSTEPQRLSRADLMSTGLDGATLDRILPFFAHGKEIVNVGYDSPLAARRADFMFKPLIEGGDGTYVAPVASTLGPACYEAVASGMRKALPDRVSKLTGDGTERCVASLFRSCGLEPSVENQRYNEGAERDAGECDLVVEDAENVVFIECKAKPLTRGTMGGEGLAVMLDYVASVVASQVQALQHERLLRSQGEIRFGNGQCLEHRGREVTRFSVTLLDHGSLQDQFLFVNLVEPLLRSAIVVEGEEDNKIRKLRAVLERHREEMVAIEGRSRSHWAEALNAAYLSYGELAVVLSENRSVRGLVDVLRKRITYGTMNPLLEYHSLKGLSLVSPDRSGPKSV